MKTGFWDAFWDGLACSTQLYTAPHDENYKQCGRVDAAWKKVGGYISASIDSTRDDTDERTQ